MNEKKKMIVIICSIVVIIIAIIAGSVYESHKSDDYLKDFYSAFESSENKLVMIGRDNCSWCQLFKPYLDFMSDNYGFEYLYVNTNELTNSSLKELLKTVGVDEKEFGTPLTVVVKDSEVVDSRADYGIEARLQNASLSECPVIPAFELIFIHAGATARHHGQNAILRDIFCYLHGFDLAGAFYKTQVHEDRKRIGDLYTGPSGI